MAATMLVCKQCNFENEPERVYCHNCGAKLDRSLLPPEATKREDPVLVQQRIRKMVKPRNATLSFQLKNLLYSLLIAVFVALVVVMLKPPGSVPKFTPEAVMDAPPIADDLDGRMQQGVPQRVVYTEDQVNTYLKATLRGGKAEKAGALAMKFEQAYVHFGDGTCQVTSEQSLFGVPIYATTVRTFSVQNGVVTSRPVGGSVGRLYLPAQAVPALEGVFQPLKKALEQPLKLVTSMQSVTLRKGSVDMVTPGRR